jgi:hypothetical protein
MSHVTGQVVFAVLLAATGGLAARLVLPSGSSTLRRLLLAFPAGAVVWATLVVMVLVAGGRLTASTLMAVWGLVALAMAWANARWRPLLPKEWVAYAGGLCVLAGLTFVVAHNSFAVFTYDSYRFLSLAWSIADLEGLSPSTAAGLGDFAVFTVTLHAAGRYFGFDYFAVYQPLMACSILAGLALGVWELSRSAAATLMSVLGVATTFAFIYHANFVHTNLSAGAMLLFALGAGWRGIEDDDLAWAPTFLFFLMGFCFHRMEAPLVASIAIVLFGCSVHRGRPAPLFGAFAFVLPVMAWNVKVMTMIGSGGVITSPARTAAMLVALIAACIVALAMSRDVRLAGWRRGVIELMRWGMVSALLGLILWQPEHMLKSLENMRYNAFHGGTWGPAWVLVALGMALAPARARPAERFLAAFLQIYVPFILALAAFRSPYRASYTDSGSRMLMHVFPIAVFFVAVRFARRAPRPDVSEKAPERSAF